MAIASSCYIREIKKTDQNLIKKASTMFGINTTPSVLMRVLNEYFVNLKVMDKQSKRIEKLERQLSESKEELKEFKFQVGRMFEAEKNLNNKRDEILQEL